MNNQTERWKAIITYRNDDGHLVDTYFFEEMSDLEEIVEGGADWHCIKDIIVTLNRRSSPAMTIEECDRYNNGRAITED